MNNLKAERTLTAEEVGGAMSIVRNSGLPVFVISDLEAMASMALQSLSTQQPMGEPVAWTWKDAGGRVKVAQHDDWFEKPRNVELLEAIPLYALHPNQESGE